LHRLGHLAGSISVLHHKFPFAEQDPLAAEFSNRPDATILCYAVVSAGEHAHNGSFNNLLGTDATEMERRQFSLEEHIDERTPPAFLWHTTGDVSVASTWSTPAVLSAMRPLWSHSA
jgi:hypothetical protein